MKQVTRIGLSLLLIAQSALNFFPMGMQAGPVAEQEVYAANGEAYDIATEKTVLSVNGSSVIYRIDVSEVNGQGVTQVRVEDIYATGMTYSGVVASTPMFSSPNTIFIDNTFGSSLIRDDMTITAGNSEYIELEFIMEEGASLANLADASACNNDECSDQFVNTYSEAPLITGPEPYVPEEYDMTIDKIVGNCDGVSAAAYPAGCTDTDATGYWLGDEVYFTIKYTNNGPNAVTHALLTDEYDTRLTFDSVVYSTQGLSTPYVAENIGYDAGGDGFAEPHNYLSFSDGFPMAVGQEELVTLKFTIDNLIGAGPLVNDSAVGVPADIGDLGQLFFYDAPFGPTLAENFTSEAVTTNNEDPAQVEIEPWDLEIEKTLTTPYTTIGDINWGDQITYRLEFTNNGPARDDIAVSDMWRGPAGTTIVSLAPEAGLVIGHQPGDAGHYYTPYVPGTTILDNVSCDAAGNCGEKLRWGDIEMAANQTSYIDVTVELPPVYGCTGTSYNNILENVAHVSLTESAGPNFLPVFDPSPFSAAQIPQKYKSLFGMTDGVVSEFDQTNNQSVDDQIGMIGNSEDACNNPVSGPYDLSLKKTVNKEQVCPGEIVEYTLTVYNSGSLNKRVRIEDFYDSSELQFKEVLFDPDRYECFYETDAYKKAIRAQVETVTADILPSSYWFPYNETYDIAHYTSNNPGCGLMYDTSSVEYQNYTTNLVAVSSAWSTHFLTQYDAYKLAGVGEYASLLNSRNDANDYISNNMATIAPTYDQAAVQAAVYSCYEEQFYDRFFFEQPVAHTPATAAAAASELAAKMSQMCTNLEAIGREKYSSCLNLGASSPYHLDSIIDHLSGDAECPMIDLWQSDNYSYRASRDNTSYPDTENAYPASVEGLDSTLPWINRLYHDNGSNPDDYYIDYPYLGPSGYNVWYPSNGIQTSAYNIYGTNKILPNEESGVLQMNLEEFYDHVGNPATDCTNVLYGVDSYFFNKDVLCGYTHQATNASVNEDYCLPIMTKSYTCDNPQGGDDLLHFAGSTFFDFPQNRYHENYQTFTNDSFVVATPANILTDTNTSKINNAYNTRGLFYVPVNTTGVNYTFSMIVDPSTAGQTVINTGYVDLCYSLPDEKTTSVLDSCILASGHRKDSESYTGDVATEGSTISGDYYVTGPLNDPESSNNYSYAEIEVLNEPVCDMSATLTKSAGGAGAFYPGQSVTYDIDYCNLNGTDPLTDITIDFDYYNSWAITSVTGSPAAYTDTNGILSRAGLTVAAGACTKISVEFEAIGPSPALDMTLDVGQAANAQCGPRHCASDTASLLTRPPKVSTPTIQDPKAVTAHDDADGDGEYSAGDEITYTLTFENTYTSVGVDGLLEAFDHFNPNQLTYVSSSSTPEYVDSINGTVKWDEGALALNATNTITVTFVINDDVGSNEEIVNASEHKLNVSAQCECAEDSNPDNNSDNALKYDLALTKVLASTGAQYQPGDDVTFDITIYNQGVVPAYNVEITDYIPAGLILNDTDWTAGAGNTATYAYSGTIPAFTGSAVVPITLQVDGTEFGTAVNWAEISDDDSEIYGTGVVDEDSSPDAFSGDYDGTPGEFAGDDAFSGDNYLSGTGVDDEDDHDPAEITIAAFDLALTKTLATTGAVSPGDDVTFNINLFNQGDLPAYNIVLTDYIPAGMTLNDPNWAASGSTATKTVMGPLAAGGTGMETITLTIDTTFTGNSLTNWSEISEADDDMDASNGVATDVDSTADNSNFNQAGETDDLNDDDVIDEDGTDGGDEDDHDPAQVSITQTYDLALTKVYSSYTDLDTDLEISQGDDVTFLITVHNQGTLPASNVEVSDYIPTGMSLSANDANGWTPGAVGTTGTITNTITGPIMPGTNTGVQVVLTIDPTFQGFSLTNAGEISDDDIETYAGIGLTGDADSTPDGTEGNDVFSGDNNTDGLGDGTDDEDDHDPASVNVGQVYDLALTKQLVSTGYFYAGDDIEYTITVENQGSLNAANVEVTDYIPAGMTLSTADTNGWTASGTNAVQTIAFLAQESSTGINIVLTIDENFTGTSLVNWAEISDDDSEDYGSGDIDSTADTDNGEEGESPTDNATDNEGGDEDDHDGEEIAVWDYDLALTKTYVTFTDDDDDGMISEGEDVTFSINVTNQGTLTGTDIQITDYIPAGMMLSVNDANGWVASGATATYTIASIVPGQTVNLPIVLTVDPNFQGTSLTNWAEISDDNSEDYGTTDSDSTPDADNFNQAGETDDLDDDNVIDEDGTDTVNDGDEDDHDPEMITIGQFFDLALTKTLVTTGVIAPGDTVSFDITIINQGTLNATDITVVDYIPAGLTLVADANWSMSGANAVTTIASLAAAIGSGPQGSVTLPISFISDGTVAGDVTNWSEIADASDGEENAVTDIDSTPDTDNGEEGESPTDNSTDGTGGDEDDHDGAVVGLGVFDLALTKTVDVSQFPVYPGDDVTFDITVINQGNIEAYGIEITDYIPANMSLNDADWTPSTSSGGPVATYTIPGPLAPSAMMTVQITLAIDTDYQGNSITNEAEISASDNDEDPDNAPLADDDSTPDGTQGNDTYDGTDNVVDEDGLEGGDEDDHDPEQFPVGQIYDLALTKKVVGSGPFDQGSEVTFQIEVTNQGTLDASGIELTDYIPSGLTLTDADWTDNGATATYVVPGTLVPGASEVIDITFTVIAGEGELTNWAEISADDAASYAGIGVTEDIDSTPDGDDVNDVNAGDNVTDGTGGDEDDHDGASIEAVSDDKGGGQTSAPRPEPEVEEEVEVIQEIEEEAIPEPIIEEPIIEFTQEEEELIQIIEVLQDLQVDPSFVDEGHNSGGLSNAQLPTFLPKTGA